jgi:hypothetical protein
VLGYVLSLFEPNAALRARLRPASLGLRIGTFLLLVIVRYWSDPTFRFEVPIIPLLLLVAEFDILPIRGILVVIPFLSAYKLGT